MTTWEANQKERNRADNRPIIYYRMETALPPGTAVPLWLANPFEVLLLGGQ